MFYRFGYFAQLSKDSFVFLSARIQGPHHFFAGVANLSFMRKFGLDLLQACLRARPRARIERILDALPQVLQFRRHLLLSQLARAHLLEYRIERSTGRLVELDAHQHAPQLQGKIFQMLQFRPFMQRLAQSLRLTLRRLVLKQGALCSFLDGLRLPVHRLLLRLSPCQRQESLQVRLCGKLLQGGFEYPDGCAEVGAIHRFFRRQALVLHKLSPLGDISLLLCNQLQALQGRFVGKTPQPYVTDGVSGGKIFRSQRTMNLVCQIKQILTALLLILASAGPLQ